MKTDAGLQTRQKGEHQKIRRSPTMKTDAGIMNPQKVECQKIRRSPTPGTFVSLGIVGLRLIF